MDGHERGSQGKQPNLLAEFRGEKVQMLLINESSLLEHAEENMHELSVLKGLINIAVICDKEMPDAGGQYGAEEMATFSEVIDELGDQRWPSLVCLRDNDAIEDGDWEDCSRHWWFGGWNARASVGGK